MQSIHDFLIEHEEEHLQLLLTLARIPAPSGSEEKRAEFCKNWLQAQGAEGVYIDDVLNVICPIGVTGDNPLVVFAAHSDVVFPDTEPLPLTVEGGRIFCPGAGDDTANVTVLLMAAKYIVQNRLQPKNCGILLVINSCEEGLGNLKGSKKLFADFGHRIREFVTLDGGQDSVVTKAVGSRRYRIEIDTEGGHSYSAFGNRNAIAYLASMIDTLYTVKVPEIGKTTYNVGTVSGGTSVNTIAQHAEMLYEFRSDEQEALTVMERHLDAAVELYRSKGVAVTVTPVGNRPCGAPVDEERMEELIGHANEIALRHYGHALTRRSGSTDCNVPLSMGIPAICVGCYRGAGAHTREEYIMVDSLLPGLKFGCDMILQYF